MPATSKHIVLVNYDFPPNDGIGGRRWGLLARAFAEDGFEVHVIKADPLPGKEGSVWKEDVIHERIHVHALPRKFPAIIGKTPSNFIQKIQYRLALNKLNKKYPGTPYDISLGWDELLVAKLDELKLNCEFEWVFATGSPWNMLRVIANWKHNNSGVKFWADLRDPWLKAKNYGIPSLDYSKKNEENDKAFTVYRYADILSGPYQEILDEFMVFDRSVNRCAKRILLPHFHGTANSLSSKKTTRTNACHLVYAGEIYLGAEAYFKQLSDDLHFIQQAQPELMDRIHLAIYSPNYTKIASLFADMPQVTLQGSVGKEIEQIIFDADYCLLVPAEHNKDFLTTKYFEFQKLKTPYLVAGASGKVTQTVINENRGTSWKAFVSAALQGEIMANSEFSQEAKVEDDVRSRQAFIRSIMEGGTL